jgi:hypothetical protein
VEIHGTVLGRSGKFGFLMFEIRRKAEIIRNIYK